MRYGNVNEAIKAPVLMKPERCPVVLHICRSKDPGLPIALHSHHEIEIQYIRKGQGEYYIGGRNYSFSRNTLLVIGPDEVHRLVPQPDICMEKFCFRFDAALLGNDAGLAELPSGFPHRMELSEKAATTIEIIIRNIIEERDAGQPYSEEVIRCELIHLLLLIRRAALHAGRCCQENPLIAGILDYIEDNFRRGVTLTQAAVLFSLSPGYLSRLFKQCTGLNFKYYVVQRQIIEAKRLLELDADRKVSAIARDVGQPNFILFNRNFKKLTGLTPSSYRKML